MIPSGSLDGVTVVDFTRVLSGPYCTMMLADHGARVIKVEPLEGDESRRFGPRDDEDPAGYGGYFQSINRNKESVAVDLRDPRGQALARTLAAKADVVTENFRPGVMGELGLSYEALSADNPALVYAAIRGFGDPRTGAGPAVDRPAFDLTAQALGGFMSITGFEGEPLKAGPGIGDIFPAVLCAFGVAMALFERSRSGRGQYLDVSMYDSMVALCERIVYQHSYTGMAPRRQGNDHPLLTPYGVFTTADGHVTIAAPSDSMWRRLCGAIGASDLAGDARFATVIGRSLHREEIDRAIQRWTSTRTNAQVCAALGDVVAVAPVQDAHDLAYDENLLARGMLAQVDDPGLGRLVTVAGVPVKFARTPGVVRRRAPLLGEDTKSVLESAGLHPDEITDLEHEGVVLTTDRSGRAR